MESASEAVIFGEIQKTIMPQIWWAFSIKNLNVFRSVIKIMIILSKQ